MASRGQSMWVNNSDVGWRPRHLAEMEKFSVAYRDLVRIKVLQGNILTSIQDGVVSTWFAEKFNSKLEGLQGAEVILMQVDWLDKLWRLPLYQLILIHHSEMEEKINRSKEQLLWLTHFHAWNQSAVWFNCSVSFFFFFCFKTDTKCFCDFKVTCIRDVLFAQINFRT